MYEVLFQQNSTIVMNPPSDKHNIEPRDLGNSGSNINNGVNSPQRKVLSGTKLQRGLHSPLMAGMMKFLPFPACFDAYKHGEIKMK